VRKFVTIPSVFSPLLDRPTNILWRASDGSTLMSFAYSYDLLGQVTNLVRHAPSLTNHLSLITNHYSYDSLDRLVNVSQTFLSVTGAVSSAESYAYDLSGNRLALESSAGGVNAATTYTLQPGNNRLAFASSASGVNATYSYDAAGNLASFTRDGIAYTLEWDILHQLMSVSTNGAMAEGLGPVPPQGLGTDPKGKAWGQALPRRLGDRPCRKHPNSLKINVL